LVEERRIARVSISGKNAKNPASAVGSKRRESIDGVREADSAVLLNRLADAFDRLLRGRPVPPVELPPAHPEDGLRRLAVSANRIAEAYRRVTDQLSEAHQEIVRERERFDRLLLNIFPVRVAEDLKQTGHTIPETFDDVTVCFADLVGFTAQAAQLEPKALIDELNGIFTGFDLIIERNDCERIKTVGDAYLAVSGMNSGHARHARNIVDAALQMLRFLEERNTFSHIRWQVRIGVHTGKVVGGIVGIRKYIYDVFGDTINTACRMEENSEPMKINISEAACRKLDGGYNLVERGDRQVKGKGAMKMFFVTGRNPSGGKG